VAVAPPADASNAERIRWEFEMLNRHDISPLKEHMWTAETVARVPDRTTRGPQELAAYLEGQFAALTGWHMDVVALAGQDDDVFVHWHLTGTHSGPMFGVEPTGKPMSVEGVDQFVGCVACGSRLGGAATYSCSSRGVVGRAG